MANENQGRILSVDVFRGFTMFLLIGEFTGVFNHITHESLGGTWLYLIGNQFHHHPWHGLRFWDLIQPYFMFIVGLSLPFAVNSRLGKGYNPGQISNHVIKRSAVLLLMGWALYCIGPGKITVYFQNVLAQIAFTYLVAFLIMKRSVGFQVLFSIAMLLLTEAIYRFFPVAGFDHPFVPNENFGTWLDLQYGGADLGGHWVSFNAIPTTAHTIWGVLIGKLLMEEKASGVKFKRMLVIGLSLVVVGYGLDWFTPVIKRIATSSFTIVTGGWSILTMALFFWIIDIMKGHGKWISFFSIVGMNSLFIYLFAHVGGADFIHNIIKPFSGALTFWSGELVSQTFTSLVTWFLLWGMCYELYRRRIFVKL